MLKPAMRYKAELEQKFAEVMYSENYFYYVGYLHAHRLPDITDADDCYRWAIVDDDTVIGYLSYYIDRATNCASGFGLYSFDQGNPVIGVDLFNELERLLTFLHRIEWRVISGNPVVRHYDKFCARHNGNKCVLHDCTKDMAGNYHDEYIYEILTNNA